MPITLDPNSTSTSSPKHEEPKAAIKQNCLNKYFSLVVEGFKIESLPCEVYCERRWQEIKDSSPLTFEQFKKICSDDCTALKSLANFSRMN